MNTYYGMAVGGPLDGQSIAYHTPEYEVVKPSREVTARQMFSPVEGTSGFMCAGLDPADVLVEVVRYIHRPQRVRGLGSKELNCDLWVPHDMSLADAFSSMYSTYGKAARLRAIEESIGNKAAGAPTRIDIEKCPCPSASCGDHFVSPVLPFVQGAGLPLEEARAVAAALLKTYPHKYVMGRGF